MYVLVSAKHIRALIFKAIFRKRSDHLLKSLFRPLMVYTCEKRAKWVLSECISAFLKGFMDYLSFGPLGRSLKH